MATSHQNARDLAEPWPDVFAREEGERVPVGHVAGTELGLVPAFPVLELPQVLINLIGRRGCDWTLPLSSDAKPVV